MDDELEWTDTYEEREFWAQNKGAGLRGANIQRIFLFDSDRLNEASMNPAIFGHRPGANQGVDGFVVDKPRFEANSPTAIAEVGMGSF